MHRFDISRPLRTMLAFFALCSALPAAQAATYTVNTAADPASGSSAKCNAGNANTCSLRDAVAAANRGDTVVFDASVTRIDLNSTLFLCLSNVGAEIVIDGGSHVVLDGGGTKQLLRHCAGTVTPYTLVGLTLRNGKASQGGAIYNAWGGTTLTLRRVRIENNRASEGGGIYNLADLVIEESTISNNQADTGAGIYNNKSRHINPTQEGRIWLTNSTLSGNSTTGNGVGSAIYAYAGEITLTNSTLWGNNNPAGTLSLLSNPEVIGDSFFRSTFVLANSLVEGCFNLLLFPADSLTDSGGNLDGGAGCGFNPAISQVFANPQLGALADNGGPTPTMLPGAGSAAIDAGVDAICADPTKTKSRDQRDAARPTGAHCDSGAVEAGAALSFALSVSVAGAGSVSGDDARIDHCTAQGGTCSATYGAPPTMQVALIATAGTGNVFTGWEGDCRGSAATVALTMNQARTCTATFAPLALVVTSAGDRSIGAPANCALGNANTCTLRDAVASATGGDTITFANGITSVVLSAEVAFADASGLAVTVDGGGTVSLAGGSHRALSTQPGAITVLKGLSARGSLGGSGNGGALYNQGTTRIDRGTFANSSATYGAAIFNASSGSLTLVDSTISSNSATLAGGGIYNNGSLSLMRSTVSANQVTQIPDSGDRGGGGIFSDGSLSLVNSTVANNSAKTVGGGIRAVTATLVNVTFAGNIMNPNPFGSGTGNGLLASGQIDSTNTLMHDCTFESSGAIADHGGNLDSGSSCGLAATASNALLSLGAIADNGGPTKTMLPGADSAAFDAGIDAACTDPAGVAGVDQRGNARPLGAHCDSGAVESEAIRTPRYQVGGTAQGHTGNVVLRLDATNPVSTQQFTVAADAAAFTFPATLKAGANWQIVVVTAPAGQNCALNPQNGNSIAADVANITLTCTDIPPPDPLTVSLTHIDTSCNGGGNGRATAAAAGGTPPYSYRWSPGGNTSNIATGLSAGDYTLTVTDSANVTASAQVTIASPPPIAFAGTTLTPGSYGAAYSTTLLASGATGALNYSIGSGGALPPGMTLTSTGALSGPSASAKTYTFSVVVADANRCESSQIFTLVIAPAPLTVSANDATRVYGAANPSFSARYAGFVNGDSAANLTPALTFATTAQLNSPAGTYAIVPSGTVGANYAPAFVNGTLTITRSMQPTPTTMTLTATPNPVAAGQPLLLTARVSAGSTPTSASAMRASAAATIPTALAPSGAVTFYDGAAAIGSATLDANGVTSMTTSALALGTHALSAVYAGDDGFAQATATATVAIVAANPPVPVPASSLSWLALLVSLLATLAAPRLRRRAG